MATGNTFTVTALDAVTETGASSAIDLSNFNVKEVYMQVEGITTATVKLQGSVDGTTYYDIALSDMDNTDNTTYVASFTADGLGKAAYAPKYLKANCSAYTAGTITATVFVKHE